MWRSTHTYPSQTTKVRCVIFIFIFFPTTGRHELHHGKYLTPRDHYVT